MGRGLEYRKGMAMAGYTLTLSKEQSKTVRLALEGYIALRENRWEVFLSEAVPNPQKRDEAKEIFEAIQKAACNGKPYWNKENLKLAKRLLSALQTVNVLRVNTDEAQLIKFTLEEYFRLRLNQWFDFTSDIALADFVYDKDNPENSRLFNEYIHRRNEAQEQFTEYFGRLRPWNTRQTIDMLRAQDIWQVIRHKLYLDRGGDPNSYVVDARPPMTLTGEAFPRFERI